MGGGFCGRRALELVRRQTELGIRAPGTVGHERAVALFEELLVELGLAVTLQGWTVPLSLAPGGVAQLTNVLARIPGRQPGPSTLVATHYDTRWIADNDPDPRRRGQPIPGANDGGSGSAVQLELARLLCHRAPRHDVILGFMDGEDLGDIEGHEYALGSAHMAANPGALQPDQVIALDMVGGDQMRLNLELNSLLHDPRAARLMSELFARGRQLELAPFSDSEPRMIRSDHWPWIEAGVPAVLLIDIDYPWWHTHQDTLDHCSPDSLEAVGRVLLEQLG